MENAKFGTYAMNGEPTIECIKAWFLAFKLMNAKSVECSPSGEIKMRVGRYLGYDNNKFPRTLGRGSYWSAALDDRLIRKPHTRTGDDLRYDDAEHKVNNKARVLAYTLYLSGVELPVNV